MNELQLYIEYDGEPVPAPNARVWTQWMLTADRTVAKTRLRQHRTMVSTVFTGFAPRGQLEPLHLYETCVFASVNSAWAEFRDRYTTRVEALAGHERVIRAITTSWQFETAEEASSVPETSSLEEWNVAVEALIDEMQRYGEADDASPLS